MDNYNNNNSPFQEGSKKFYLQQNLPRTYLFKAKIHLMENKKIDEI